MEINVCPVYKKKYRKRILDDEEIWAPLEPLGIPAYEISSFGNARKIGKTKILVQTNDAAKPRICFNTCDGVKNRTVAVLVAETFIEKPDTELALIVHCNDGDSRNSKVTNLRFVTWSEQLSSLVKKSPRHASPNVIQRDMHGVVVKKWDSVLSILDHNPTYNKHAITYAILVKKSKYGSTWEYDKEDLEGETWKEHPRLTGLIVSDLGRVQRPNGTSTYGTLSVYGYYTHAYKKKPNRVSRLVAETFIGPLGDNVVNHINGLKNDNRAVNLEIVTQSSNCKHASDTGLSKAAKAILKIDPITDEIIMKYKSSQEAAEKNGIKAPGSIRMACNGNGGDIFNNFRWRFTTDENYVDKAAVFDVNSHEDTTISSFVHFAKSLGKSVLKIDMDTDEILSVYDSIATAARENECGASGISIACKKKQVNAVAGYRWSYANDTMYSEKLLSFNGPSITNKRIRFTNDTKQMSVSRPVLKMDIDTNEHISLYENAIHAATENDISSCYIHRVCNGVRSTYKGFRWCYADDPGFKTNLVPSKRNREASEDGPVKKKRKTA